jgi:hypothetical protein
MLPDRPEPQTNGEVAGEVVAIVCFIIFIGLLLFL